MDANWERKLSKWGRRVYWTIFAVVMSYFFWGAITNTGIPAWLADVQASIMDGRFSPMLTGVLLAVPTSFVVYPVGLLFDYLTDQGLFAPPTLNPSEQADPSA